jgi:replicative DNA helicase
MTDNTDNLSKYGQQYQTKVISNLVTDRTFLEKVSDVLHPKYFEADTNKWIIEHVTEYFKTYKNVPTTDYFKTQLHKLTDAALQQTIARQLKEVYSHQNASDKDWVKEEFVTFCKNQNFKEVILKSVDLLKLGQFDKIEKLVRDAVKVGQTYDLGLNYKDDVAVRFEDVNRRTVKTGWDVIDELMDGGLGPGELGVVVAPSGIGKTWILSHIGAEAVKQGKNVLHYTLELTQNYVGQRYDTIFTGIPSATLKENTDIIKDKIERLNGGMLIKYYPPKGITANTIAAHVEMVRSTTFQPDLIIIDYADLLVSINGKNNSDYQEAGGIYIDLRALSGEYQIPIWTASQTNRSAIDSEIIQADKIADSYAKVMNADFILSVSRKDTDKLNNTARVHVMKNRFGPDGMTFPTKMDTNKGIIEIYASNSPNGIIAQKDAKNGEVLSRQLLQKKYMEVNDLG